MSTTSPTTPLSLRLEARGLNDLRAIADEIARLNRYAAEHAERPPRINPTQTLGNRVLHGVPADEAADAVLARIAAVGGLARNERRNDQNIAAEVIMTVDAAWAAARERAEPGWRDRFCVRAVQFLTAKYGAENVISATMHVDEAAPHVHAIVVPVAEVTGRNRHGSYTRTRVSFSKVFGGDRATYMSRARERREGRSAETPLGRLQTEAAEALADLDVVRGVRGSARFRRHMTRGEFYDVIRGMQAGASATISDQAPDVPAEQIPAQRRAREWAAAQPPAVTTEERTAIADHAFRAGLQSGWTAACRAWKRNPVIADAAKAAVAKKREAAAAESAARAMEREDEERRRREMAEKTRAELIAAFKPLSASDLDLWLGDACPLTYTDSTGRTRSVRTAFDRLLHVERMPYEAAIAWLADKFGTEEEIGAIANAAAETVRADTAVRIRTLIDRRIVRGLQMVSKAVGCPLQVYAFDPDEKEKGYEIYPRGKSVNAWNEDDWAENLGVLKAKNGVEKLGIYAYPAESVVDRALILVDDVCDGKRPPAEAADYVKRTQPNLYVQTSAAKTQAVFVAYGDPREGSADYAALLRTAQDENRLHGDMKLNNLRHAFRLPGFYNTKKKYKNATPLVTISGTPRTGESAYIRSRVRAMAAALADGLIRPPRPSRKRREAEDEGPTPGR